MGKTFVYNAGSAQVPTRGLLKLEYGLFFDGTCNNRRNTEIRKKVEGKGEFKDITATAEEKNIYDKYAKDDNSFGNDFTNVARKFYCCDEEYRIYVEGIGTVDKKDDVGSGYIYGRGYTGIISKVRKGCESLAEKILEDIKKSTDEINKIEVTIDAFGFSRGAAAARNFLYNLQMKAYYPRKIYNKYVIFEIDHDGYFIENSWVKDLKLPRLGHLGTALLKAGLDRELLDSMEVKVRFLGIYDTVASYYPEGVFPNFEKHIDKLHLHDLGRPKKAVHFTAMDEHRKNFSLTRLNIPKFTNIELHNGIERNFPGVHSDVGGSYNHDSLSLEDINKYKDAKPSPIKGISEREHVHLDEAFSYNLYSFRDELIDQGWYKENQLSIEFRFLSKNFVLEGTRYLYRGYSFIPLHFMCEYALPLLNQSEKNLKYDKIFNDYPLNDDFLEEVKNYLRTHTIEKGNNWQLKGDFSKDDTTKEEVEELPIQPYDNDEDNICVEKDLSEIKIFIDKSDILLRKLRNRYLHRSAKINTISDRFANSPNSDRKRKEF